MGLKEDRAEKFADRLIEHIDRMARAHAMNDARAAEDARIKLWATLKALIIELDHRVHTS